jgi:hypothetical protein
VSAVDRTASNDQNRYIAEVVFRRTGLLYEPKRGEYSEALHKNFIHKDDIIERVLFTRIMHIACGRFALGVERKMMRNTGGIIPELSDDHVVDVFSDLYEIYTEIAGIRTPNGAADKMINDLIFTVFVHALRKKKQKDGNSDWLPLTIEQARELFEDFGKWARENLPEFLTARIDKISGAKRIAFSSNKWRKSSRYPNDVQVYIDLLEDVKVESA